MDEYHLVWLPTGEWLYVRLEVGALSVNASSLHLQSTLYGNNIICWSYSVLGLTCTSLACQLAGLMSLIFCVAEDGSQHYLVAGSLRGLAFKMSLVRSIPSSLG